MKNYIFSESRSLFGLLHRILLFLGTERSHRKELLLSMPPNIGPSKYTWNESRDLLHLSLTKGNGILEKKKLHIVY